MNINPTTHDNLSAALLSRAKHGSVIIGLDEIDLAQLGITQSTHVSAAFAAHGFATADPAAHALATADIATSTATAHDPATASPYTARRLRLTQRDGFALHSATASPYTARRLRLTQRDGFALRNATASPYARRQRRQTVRAGRMFGGKVTLVTFSTVCCTPLWECSFILIFKMKAKFLGEENAFTPHEHTSCPPRRSVK